MEPPRDIASRFSCRAGLSRRRPFGAPGERRGGLGGAGLPAFSRASISPPEWLRGRWEGLWAGERSGERRVGESGAGAVFFRAEGGG